MVILKKVILQAVLILIAFILHTSLFPVISFNGIIPNVLLVLTIFCTLEQGLNTGMVTGFVCGILCDIFFGSTLGVYGLLYLLIAFFAGSMARFFYKDDLVFPTIMIVISDLLYSIAMYVMNFLLRGRFEFRIYFQGIILPELVYTLLLTVLCLPAVAAINRRMRRIRIKEKETEDGNAQTMDQKDH